jgi:DnaJ-class molecular chaperone
LEDDGRDQFGSMFADAYGGKGVPAQSAPQDVLVILDCTLFEFYNGCVKHVEFDREVAQHDGKTTKTILEERTIEVKPGFSEATEISFPGKGNEMFGYPPSNLVVKFKQTAHTNYRRKDNDLVYTQKITLEEALLSSPISFVSSIWV